MNTWAAGRGIGTAGVFEAGVLPVARLERLLHSASLSEIQGESCRLDANADVSLLARRAPFAPVVGGGRHGVVGQALVAYLSGERPATDERWVFVEHLGDRRGKPLSSPAVSRVVARALRRAAVDTPLTGAYVFRHTVASRMVREGASLKEVADVVGHRSLDTTTIYVKRARSRVGTILTLQQSGAGRTPTDGRKAVRPVLRALRPGH